MNPKLRGYTRGDDGKYRKRVEFDVRNRPGIASAINLVRSSDGTLRKSETIGWIRLAVKPQQKEQKHERDSSSVAA